MSGEQEQFQQENTFPDTQSEGAEQQPPLGENQSTANEESRTSEEGQQQEETDEQKAARLVKENQLRQRRERNRIEAERRLAEKERDTYRQMVERLIDREDRKAAPPQDREPTRDFNPETGKPFETYDEFVEARASYKAEKRALEAVSRQMQEAAMAYQRQVEAAEMARTRTDHNRRMDSFAREVPDFEDVAARDDIEIPRVAGTILEQMENGPALIYAIAQQPQIAATLRGMDSPLQMATYLGQLSQWLSSSRSSRISNAAPAGRTVGSKPGSSSTPPDNPDDYERWANKRFGRR